MANKYYNSLTWLRRRLYHDKKSPEEIAKECGVSHMTIYRKIKEFGLDK